MDWSGSRIKSRRVGWRGSVKGVIDGRAGGGGGQGHRLHRRICATSRREGGCCGLLSRRRVVSSAIAASAPATCDAQHYETNCKNTSAHIHIDPSGPDALPQIQPHGHTQNTAGIFPISSTHQSTTKVRGQNGSRHHTMNSLHIPCLQEKYSSKRTTASPKAGRYVWN